MPLSAFPAHEQHAARIHLLYCRVRGMTRLELWFKLRREERESEDLLRVLEDLHALDPNFHRSIEFDLYLHIDQYSVRGADRALRALVPAFAAAPSLFFLREMRNAAHWLIARSDDDWDEDLTEEEQNILAAQPDLMALLVSSCETLERVGSPDDARVAKVFRLDCLARNVAYDEVEQLADDIRAIPGSVATQNPSGFRPRQGLEGCPTPQAWAFLVEAAVTSRDGWARLDSRYPEELGNLVCDGLRQLVRALVVPPAQAAACVAKGVELLSQMHMAGREDCFGQFLLLQQDDGLDDVDCGLHLPRSADLVLRFVEHAAPEFPFSDELMTLRAALEASGYYATIELSSDVPVLAGVDWLVEQSLSFATMMADVAPSTSERLFYATQSLRRQVDAGLPAFESVSERQLESAEIVDPSVAERLGVEVLELHKRLLSMDASHHKEWGALVGPVFDVLNRAHQGPVRADSILYRCALAARDSLAVTRPMLVARLDELAGNWAAALGQYLMYMEQEGLAQAEAEAGGLIARAPTAAVLGELERTVREQRLVSGDKTFAEGLYRKILERLRLFEKTDQFSRTAVSRWPALNPQARKVLSVLCTIKTYRGFDELGSYAGMNAEWAERHYRRLVTEGMVFETNGGWQVNPHIAPLIAQESRHAVVGRIIRAGGTTTAIKQVFNSEREHTIYDALVQLCPNHLVFPNCSLQSIFSYDRMQELVTSEDFSYYLLASVDVVIVSTTTYLPLLAIEVDSVYHDTDRQRSRDDKKDRIFQAGGLPLLRLRPAGSPSAETIRGQVAEHLDELLTHLRQDLPGYDQAISLLRSLT